MSRGMAGLGETPATLAAPTENRLMLRQTALYYYYNIISLAQSLQNLKAEAN